MIKNIQQGLLQIPKKVDYKQINIDESPLKDTNSKSLQLETFPQQSKELLKKDITSLYD